MVISFSAGTISHKTKKSGVVMKKLRICFFIILLSISAIIGIKSSANSTANRENSSNNNEQEFFILKGNLPSEATPDRLIGHAKRDEKIERMILVFNLRHQAELDQLLIV